jgi:hypothetical protein
VAWIIGTRSNDSFDPTNSILIEQTTYPLLLFGHRRQHKRNVDILSIHGGTTRDMATNSGLFDKRSCTGG